MFGFFAAIALPFVGVMPILRDSTTQFSARPGKHWFLDPPSPTILPFTRRVPMPPGYGLGRRLVHGQCLWFEDKREDRKIEASSGGEAVSKKRSSWVVNRSVNRRTSGGGHELP